MFQECLLVDYISFTFRFIKIKSHYLFNHITYNVIITPLLVIAGDEMRMVLREKSKHLRCMHKHRWGVCSLCTNCMY